MLRDFIANTLYRAANLIGGIDFEARRELEKRAKGALAKIMETADERMAAQENEMDRRSRLGTLGATAPEIWRHAWYMRQSYRIIHSDDNTQNHWRGGKPQHEGAECSICKKPLVLFWDIDCSDARFTHESPLLFEGLNRLPLYYCCRRPEPTAYQVVSPDRIVVFRPELTSGEESPFGECPESFARSSISLEAIPREVENLLAIINNYEFAWLDEAERSFLAKYFGKEITGRWDLDLSQFGGAPLFSQGHRRIKCPNPACATRDMGNPLLDGERQFEMKELAVIGHDSRFEFEMNFCQIAFYICWKCLTVHADYRCD